MWLEQMTLLAGGSGQTKSTAWIRLSVYQISWISLPPLDRFPLPPFAGLAADRRSLLPPSDFHPPIHSTWSPLISVGGSDFQMLLGASRGFDFQVLHPKPCSPLRCLSTSHPTSTPSANAIGSTLECHHSSLSPLLPAGWVSTTSCLDYCSGLLTALFAFDVVND